MWNVAGGRRPSARESRIFAREFPPGARLVSAPITQDLFELGIADDKEAQGSPVVFGRMKGGVSLSHEDGQLSPAGRDGRWRFGG